MTSFLSNLASNVTSAIGRPTIVSMEEDRVSLTQYVDDALSDSDEEWRMSMLQEELNAPKGDFRPQSSVRSPNVFNEYAPPKFNASAGYGGYGPSPKSSYIQALPGISRGNVQSSRVNIEGPTEIATQPSTGTRIKDAVSNLIPWMKKEEVSPPPPQPQTISDRVRSAVIDVSKRVGLVKEPEKPKKWYELWAEKINKMITLSKTTRLYGFGITAAIGVAFLVLSFFLLSYSFLPFFGQIFALAYSCAQLSFLLSSFFLAGPLTQIRQMLTPKRVIPTCIYIISLALTLVAALQMKNVIICLILIIIQIIALGFYLVTYIPYSGTIFNFALRGVWNSIG